MCLVFCFRCARQGLLLHLTIYFCHSFQEKLKLCFCIVWRAWLAKSVHLICLGNIHSFVRSYYAVACKGSEKGLSFLSGFGHFPLNCPTSYSVPFPMLNCSAPGCLWSSQLLIKCQESVRDRSIFTFTMCLWLSV